jgi:hypothetical protein
MPSKLWAGKKHVFVDCTRSGSSLVVIILDDKVESIKYEAKPDPDAWINTEEFKFYTQPVILKVSLRKIWILNAPEIQFLSPHNRLRL